LGSDIVRIFVENQGADLTSLHATSVRVSQSKAARRSMGATAGIVAEFALAMLLACVTYGLPVVAGGLLGSAAITAIAVTVTVVISVVLSATSFRGFLFYWFALVVLQNAFVGAWFPDSYSDSVPAAVTEAKTVAALTAIGCSIAPMVRYLRARRGPFIAIVIYIVLILVNIQGFSDSAVAYLRNFLLPVLLLVFFASRTVKLDRAKRLELLWTVILFVSVVLVSGTLLEYGVSTPVWRDVFHATSIEALQGLSTSTSIAGFELPRVAGFIVEPTNAGYLATAVIVVALVAKLAEGRSGRYGHVVAAVLAGSFVLVGAAAKNGLLMLAVAAVCWIVARRTQRTGLVFFLCSTLSLLAVVTYSSMVQGRFLLPALISDPVSVAGGDSTTFHLAGLFAGTIGALDTPFGHGIGVGGNFSKISTGSSWDDWLGTGGESSWGVLGYQAGVAGLALLLISVVLLSKRWGLAATIALCVWSTSAMYAEAIFGPQSAALLLLTAALVRHEPEGTLEKGKQMQRRNAYGAIS
jgi:hypothetical protein